jgi:hypothetical protein
MVSASLPADQILFCRSYLKQTLFLTRCSSSACRDGLTTELHKTVLIQQMILARSSKLPPGRIFNIMAVSKIKIENGFSTKITTQD